MPTNVAYDKDERIYVQNESTFGIVPNTSGTATLTGANAMRHIDVTLEANEGGIVREDKTGDRTRTPSIPGQYGGTWSVNSSWVANGTAGTVPDSDPILATGFLNAATLNTGTASVSACTTGSTYGVTTTAAHGWSSGDGVWVPKNASNAPWGAFVILVTSTTAFTLVGANSTVAITNATAISRVNVAYTLQNLPGKSFSLWHFRTPSTIRQEVALGSVVASMKWSAGAENQAAKFAASGVSKWVLDNKSVADSIPDLDQLGGLTTFPAEPGSPVTNGGIIPSFMGYLFLNGSTLAKLRSWDITHNTGQGLPMEYIGTRYGQQPEADLRSTELGFVVDDDDSTGGQLLYEAAQTMTTFDGVFCQGNLSQGNAWLWYCRGIQLAMPKTASTGRKFTRNFSGAIAHGSGIATLDEIKLINC